MLQSILIFALIGPGVLLNEEVVFVGDISVSADSLVSEQPPFIDIGSV
jgi:hypothetical protein